MGLESSCLNCGDVWRLWLPARTAFVNALELMRGLVSMTLPYVAPSACIDIYSCVLVPSHEAINNNARDIKQLCNAYYTGSGGQHANPFMLNLAYKKHYHNLLYNLKIENFSLVQTVHF